MATFSYKALPEGSAKEISGEIEAASYNEALAALSARRLVVLSVQELSRSARPSLKVKDVHIAQLFRTLGTLLNAGVTLSVALESLSQHKVLGPLAKRWIAYNNAGLSLSQSMEQLGFAPAHVAAARASEEGGSLGKVFLRLAGELDESIRIRDEIRGALTYPVAILGFIGLAVYFLLTGFVPRFMQVLGSMGLKPSDYPIYTQIVIAVSDFLRSNGLIFFVGVAAIVAAAVLWARTPAGSDTIDRSLYKLPIIGAMRRTLNVGIFLSNLSSLLAAAVNMPRALEISGATTGSVVYKEVARNLKKRVEAGQLLSQAMKAEPEWIPSEIPPLVAAGEQGNAIPDLTEKYAQYLKEQVRRGVQQNSKLIEPALIVVMAVVVGGLILSLMVPFYDAINKLQQIR